MDGNVIKWTIWENAVGAQNKNCVEEQIMIWGVNCEIKEMRTNIGSIHNIPNETHVIE